MRHTVQTCQQRVAQDLRRTGRQLIFVPFSFYDLASDLQKSIDGFMFNLWNQCLQAADRLAQCVLPVFQKHKKRWTPKSFLEAVEALLSQKDIPIQVVVFLDALDECSQALTAVKIEVVTQLSPPVFARGSQLRYYCVHTKYLHNAKRHFSMAHTVRASRPVIFNVPGYSKIIIPHAATQSLR